MLHQNYNMQYAMSYVITMLVSILLLILYFDSTTAFREGYFWSKKWRGHPGITLFDTEVEVVEAEADLSRASSNQVETVRMLLREMTDEGPGHISSMPISSTVRAQKELTKLVLTIVIAWLTLDTKLRDIWMTAKAATAIKNKTGTEVGMPFDSESDWDVLSMAGIKVDDLKQGSGPPATPGDIVGFTFTVFYNGLAIVRSTDTTELMVIADVGSVEVDGSNELAGRVDDSLPTKGCALALGGMRQNGLRRATLPPEVAFGSDGLPPFIPANAQVIIELSIQYIK
jgi:FKBP-type peptidyl-prolyl cis-trans isomerase